MILAMAPVCVAGIKIGIVLLVAWLLYGFSRRGERWLRERWHQDVMATTLFSKVCLIAIGVGTMLLILPILGIPVAGLLAFGGLGGIIVGFAAKDAIANILAGFVLVIDRPFSIREQVYTPDGKLEGWVEAIGWRTTSIRTMDKQLLYVPNHLFSSMVYVNKSRVTHYRIWKTLQIRYQDAKVVPQILESIRAYLKQRPDLDQGEYHFIHLSHLGDSAFSLECRIYVKTSDYRYYYRAMEEILLRMYEIVQECGGSLAYPTQEIHLCDIAQEDARNRKLV